MFAVFDADAPHYVRQLGIATQVSVEERPKLPFPLRKQLEDMPVSHPHDFQSGLLPIKRHGFVKEIAQAVNKPLAWDRSIQRLAERLRTEPQQTGPVRDRLKHGQPLVSIAPLTPDLFDGVTVFATGTALRATQDEVPNETGPLDQ